MEKILDTRFHSSLIKDECLALDRVNDILNGMLRKCPVEYVDDLIEATVKVDLARSIIRHRVSKIEALADDRRQ